MNDFQKQLQTLKQARSLTPDAAWMRAAAERLRPCLTARETVEPKPAVLAAVSWAELFIPRTFFIVARRALVFVLLLGLATYGWGVSVSASQYSLPGDILYSVKLANEKKELFFAGSQQAKVEVLLDHATKRAQELEQIQKNTDTAAKKEQQTKVVVASLKEKITSTNQEIEKLKSEKSVNSAALASVVEEKTDEISGHLAATLIDETTQSTIASTTPSPTAATSLEGDLAEVATLIEETTVQAVAAVVESVTTAPTPTAPTLPETALVGQTLDKTVERLTTDLTALSGDLAAAASSSLFASTSIVMTVPEAPTTSSEVAPSSSTASITSTTPLLAVSSSLSSSSLVSTSTPDSTLSVPVSATGTIVTSSEMTTGTSATLTQAPLIIPEPEKPVPDITLVDIAKAREQLGLATTTLAEAKKRVEEKNWAGALQKIQEVYAIKKDIQPIATVVRRRLPIQVATEIPATASTTVSVPNGQTMVTSTSDVQTTISTN